MAGRASQWSARWRRDHCGDSQPERLERRRTGDALRSLYDAESSRTIKVEIANALFVQRNGATLVQMARAEKDTDLKREIVQRLSMMRQSEEAMDYLVELLK